VIGIALVACDAADRPRPGPTLIAEQPTITSVPSKVMLIIEQASYLSGEQIRFVVANNSEETIYYNYGCGWPNPFKLEADERIGLAVFIIEEYPPTKEIPPGETHDCFWDQTAWQNPGQEGSLRFQSYVSSELVPSGQYELGFFYYLNSDEVGYGEHAIAVWSGPFLVE
jgi:hypothetical protein